MPSDSSLPELRTKTRSGAEPALVEIRHSGTFRASVLVGTGELRLPVEVHPGAHEILVERAGAAQHQVRLEAFLDVVGLVEVAADLSGETHHEPRQGAQ